MNTFNYNSSEVNYYVSTDLGSIADPVSSTVDNGDTAYDLVVSGDYIVTGDVLVNDFVEQDYDEINFTETTYPFGTIKIGSEVGPAATVVFVAKPEPIRLYTKSISVRKRAWVGSGTLFELSNGLERVAAPYIGGSGPLRVSGAAEDSATFKFTEESVKTYGVDVDFGLVTGAIGSSVDYGQTTDVVDEGETDHGDILSGDGIPYGLFTFAGGNTTDVRIKAWQGSGSTTISGQASEQFNEPTPQIYIVNNLRYGRIPSLFRVYNSVNPDAFSRASYIGSGSLFEIGQKDEKAVFVYNVDPISGQTYETIGSSDSGTVDQSAGTNEDYGTVTTPFTNGILNYGQLNPGLFKFGNLNITGGDRAHANPRAYRGDGQLNTSGAATVQFNEPSAQVYIYGLNQNQTSQGEFLKFGGTAAESTANVPPEPIGTAVTAGSIFSSGEKEESITFDYNLESVVYLGDDIDYGSVTTSSSGNEDLGLVTQSATNGEVSFGQVLITSITYPYGGLFKLSGGDIAHANPVAYLGATAEINITGGATEKFTSGAGESTVLFRTSGGDGDAIIKVFTGEGSLFHIGDRVEKKVYSYNPSSIVSIEQSIDSGLISSATTQTDDYGSVSSAYEPPTQDYGDVITLPGEENPFGLFEISGSATDEFFPTFAWNRKSPAIRIFNEQQDPADFRFMPHWRSRHLLGTPTIRNAPDGEFNTYARVRPYIGSGSLFSIGDKLERVAYDYNESSVADFTVGGDYGFVSSSSTTNVDYGSVTNVVTEGEFDNGQIVITDIEYPLTGLFSFTGSAVGQFFRGPYNAKDGLIRIYKGQSAPTDFRFMPHWRGVPDEAHKVSGDGGTPRSRVHVGSGSLFHIGDRIEKAVFSYNTSSVVDYEVEIDYGTISTTPTGSVDNGSVTNISSGGELDNGQIVITETTQPYGLFNITGKSIDKWHQVFTKVGSGSLFSAGGAAESQTDRYPGDEVAESTVLFTATGSLTESFSKGLYSGSGSLFHIGDRIEKAVFSYNTSSVIGGSGSEDNGFISNPATSSVDNGSVSSDYLPPNTDHGLVFTVPGDENPFGLFRIAGGDIGHKQTFREVVSGSLFGIGNAAEAAVWQTPEETFLLKMRGGAIEKHVENWVGTGNIKIKEETPLAPNAAVRFRPHWRTQHLLGTPRIFGSGAEEFKGAYVSKGVFSRMYTHDKGNEWRRYRPSPRYVNSVYGKIGGSAIVQGISDTRKINVYGYYGDDRDPGTSGSLFTFNSSTQAVGYNPITDTVLFKAYGSSPSKWNPAWTSRPDGSPRLSGTPELQLRFNIFTNPEGEKFIFSGTPNLKISLKFSGSGSLFALGGSTETRGFNPTTDTLLFRAGGNPIVVFSLLHIGSGSLFGLGGAAESRTIDVPTSTVLFIPSGTASEKSTREYIGEGSTSISGNLVESQTDSYAGEGSLFTANGAAEVVSVSETESTILFVPSGTATDSRTRSAIAEGNVTISDNLDEAFARPYVGEGSLFGFNGAAEAVTVDEESTGLFTFIGSASIERSRDFVGSGSLFSVGGAAEIAAVAPESTGLFTISGSADESRTNTIIDNGGTTFVYGSGDEAYSRPYTGTGSLFSVGGATEVFSNAVPENTVLYDIDGRGVVTRTRGFEGSESINVFNEDLIPVVTLSYIGSGDLTTFGGAAESRTITSESTVLFTPSGTANESFTKAIIDNEGSATISGGISDVKLTRSANVFAYVSTDGQAIERQTDHYTGSGSLFGLNSATIARAVDYDETSVGAQGEIISTNLFTFNGSNPGSVTRITQPGTAKLKVTGSSVNVLRLFSPIRIFGTII